MPVWNIFGRGFDSRRLHQSLLKRSAKRRLPRRSHKAKTGIPDASINFASLHTSKQKPWMLVTCLAFSDKSKVVEFDRYFKLGSGHAFANKRLW